MDTGTAVGLVIGLLVFAGLTVWQVRAITGSRYPAMRAFEAVWLIIPLLPAAVRLDVFSDGTRGRGELHPAADPHRRPVLQRHRLHDGGLRGHHPKSETARVVLIVQMLADLALLGAGARVLLGAVRCGRQRSGTGKAGAGAYDDDG